MTPPSPEGVKIVRGDQTVPCELVYEGKNDKDLDVWRVVSAAWIPGDQIHCEKMPPRSSLIFVREVPRD